MVNKNTGAMIAALEQEKPFIGTVKAAAIMGMAQKTLMCYIENADKLPPFVVDVTLPGERKRYYKIATERLAAWLAADDMRKGGEHGANC